MRLRIAKKETAGGWRAAAIRIISVLVALLFSGLIMAAMGFDPIAAYLAIAKGSFGSARGLINTVTVAIPLLIVALGLSISFSMRFWNIGGEGQMVMGAIFATYAAHQLPETTPAVLYWVTMALAAMIGGGLYALIPGLFRAYSGTNETLFTLMLNYVAIKVAVFLRLVLWKDPAAKGFPQIKAIPEAAHLPKIFGVHIGWIIALVVTVFVAIYLKYTKRGYETRVVGESERTAHYAGINVRRVLVGGVALSGAIVGLAGFAKLSGVSHVLSESIGGGNGFSAVIVAWLAQLNAPVMILIALLFAAMEQGAMGMELALKIPVSVSDVIKGLILFSALASEFFISYHVVIEKGPRALLRQYRRSGRKELQADTPEGEDQA
ncbi:MAG: ABC transporter permease [Eubacteriales bacterium]|nr:ABC transporter permease [Eubacteriales bacterium]